LAEYIWSTLHLRVQRFPSIFLHGINSLGFSPAAPVQQPASRLPCRLPCGPTLPPLGGSSYTPPQHLSALLSSPDCRSASCRPPPRRPVHSRPAAAFLLGTHILQVYSGLIPRPTPPLMGPRHLQPPIHGRSKLGLVSTCPWVAAASTLPQLGSIWSGGCPAAATTPRIQSLGPQHCRHLPHAIHQKVYSSPASLLSTLPLLLTMAISFCSCPGPLPSSNFILYFSSWALGNVLGVPSHS
jgi:hypothetical protein